MWEKEDFEDKLTRGMMAVYDYEWDWEFKEKELRPEARFNHVDWNFIRGKGLYFSPSDRILDVGEVDIRNDGLPAYAIFTMLGNDQAEDTEDRVANYLQILTIRRINRVYEPFIGPVMGTKYLTYYVAPRLTGGCTYLKYPVVVDSAGKVWPCDVVLDGSRKRLEKWDKNHYENLLVQVCGSICGWQDRLHLWNVQATDGKQKAIFGVYQEEVKSLFYSRKAPVTQTGRLRPILHWVKSHRKRMKNGVDIEIDDYLRGTNKFEMDGFQFTINRPELY